MSSFAHRATSAVYAETASYASTVAVGAAAPTDADYLVKTANGSLSAERVVTDGTSVTADWATPAQVTFKRAALIGDVTAGADSNSTTIANDAVTYAKLQNVAGFSVVGKTSTGAGDAADITAADETVLGRTAAGNLSFAQLATGQIANDAVTYAKLQNVAGFSVVGKTATGAGDAADITAADETVLGRTAAGNLAFASLTTNQITAAAVTYAKMVNSAGYSVTGKATTGAGDHADITAADETVLGRTGAGNLAFAQVAAGQIATNAVTTAKILDANVTLAKIVDGTAVSVLGRSANSTGVYANIAAGSDGQVLKRSAGALSFAQVALTTDVTGDLPFANLAQVAGVSVLGVVSGSTADVAAITAGTDGHVLRRSSSTLLGFSNIGVPVFVRKTPDQAVTSSTTLVVDSALTFPVAASQTWQYEFFVRYLGNTAGGFRCGLKFPTSPTTIAYNVEGLYPGAAVDGNGTVSGSHVANGNSSADAVSGLIMGASTTAALARLSGILINGANAGSVTLWWAQGVSNATPTVVKTSSYVIATRVA